MNILFSCAGRRNYLLQYFKKHLNGNDLIIATDTSLSAPALSEADIAIKVPPFSDKKYIQSVLNICKKHSVSLLISLNDYDISILSNYQEEFSKIGVKLLISSPNIIEKCLDKLESEKFSKEIGIKYPKTYSTIPANIKAPLRYPLYIKPRFGSGSFGLEKANSWEELNLAWNLNKLRYPDTQFIIQESLPGEEFGVDIINDLSGNYITSIVKRKISMRSGETERAIIQQEKAIVDLAEKIALNLKHIGNLDCDVFYDGNEAYLLEMNPRFGGGYPFSYAAGVDLPKAIVFWLKNKNINIDDWINLDLNHLSAKCDRIVSIKK